METEALSKLYIPFTTNRILHLQSLWIEQTVCFKSYFSKMVFVFIRTLSHYPPASREVIGILLVPKRKGIRIVCERYMLHSGFNVNVYSFSVTGLLCNPCQNKQISQISFSKLSMEE